MSMHVCACALAHVPFSAICSYCRHVFPCDCSCMHMCLGVRALVCQLACCLLKPCEPLCPCLWACHSLFLVCFFSGVGVPPLYGVPAPCFLVDHLSQFPCPCPQETEATVLYHPSSGQICHASGQDPLHLDDDIIQYMWHGFIWLMASSFIIHHCFTSIHPFCFCLDCFHLSWPPMDKAHPWLIPMKLGHNPWISSPWPNLWHSSLLRKCGECSGRDRQ